MTTGCRPDAPSNDSGGPLLPEQAAYDVSFYDLALAITPEEKTVRGTLTAHAALRDTLRKFVLDLDPRLTADSATVNEQPAVVERRGGRLWIDLPRRMQRGDSVQVAVAYHGEPRVAPNPPWEGGFTWAETPAGQPWIATSCQTSGADLWWPVKDHPSDEPDSLRLRITVPKPLVVAANGVLRGVDEQDAAHTYEWFVSTPINPYTVALAIAPYARLDTTYQSTAGTAFPFSIWALPSDTAAARAALPEFMQQMRFFEETLGPYPFRADKYGVAQTPFAGMEHQTIIAHGRGFGGTHTLGYDTAVMGDTVAFDALHLHELAHEWWGNLVTAADWKDFWIHESFATYMEALYAEQRGGRAAYRQVLEYAEGEVAAGRPIARRASASAQEMYFRDVYFKGSLVLHALRQEIGDDAFFRGLRRVTYPSDSLEAITDGRQTRLATTDEIIRTFEDASGQDLGAFFDRYLYGEEVPPVDTSRAVAAGVPRP